MQTLYADPIDDTMPLNETDKAWIREAIRLAHERHGWGKFTGFIKDWSGAGAAVGILVFLLTQWSGYIEFRTTANIRLGNIEESLKQIHRDLSPLQISAEAALPIDTFQARLPKLKTALSTAKKEQLPVSPKVMLALQSNLLSANQDSPEFWPTVAEFISYRSESTVQALRPNLHDCTDGDPSPMKIVTATPKSFDISVRVYEDCRLTLDSPEDTAKLNWLVTHTAPFLKFRRCLIVYRGGTVNLIIALNKFPLMMQVEGHPPDKMEFSGPTLSFANCRFDFNLGTEPPKEGREVTTELLAQSADSASLTLRE